MKLSRRAGVSALDLKFHGGTLDGIDGRDLEKFHCGTCRLWVKLRQLANSETHIGLPVMWLSQLQTGGPHRQ